MIFTVQWALDNTVASSLPKKREHQFGSKEIHAQDQKVLRLRFELGLGCERSPRSCSVGLGTAHEYLQQPKLPASRGRVERIA
jgi:hypothetical protein